MHPVAKRCLTWAIVLVVVGAALYAWGSDLMFWFTDTVGAGAEPAVWIYGFLLAMTSTFALPLAAGLVTATILIQTLAPRSAASTDAAHSD